MLEKYKRKWIVRRTITLLAVIISAVVQVYVIQAFIRPAN